MYDGLVGAGFACPETVETYNYASLYKRASKPRPYKTTVTG